MEERALPAEVSSQFFRHPNSGTLTLILVQIWDGGKIEHVYVAHLGGLAQGVACSRRVWAHHHNQ